uniref:Pre-rRNA-processing protein Ipi1 N-terminal domain-containing protein n=1 Tax=Mucochytrium quahogii TaxID=96639 RepID=A0A7S2WN60_9STRA|mmetsp:Transcript_5151/g.11359  ORF Transcript_5151/g.11359 Transcript_5151/m.11359 type:complete len:917 (+) Transcript_5151:288-3038(+)|eukprot:CAMPEP_0203744780 /NCGR_PEP_ID=MMETSP0098-20131031/732_1 /ASSEMBLY_ACC=CAM_ASM_000208 /TAXON_ID=96639 /ORGANISM=" , Strain NY0313808BC1" /LENGTH=916 /DNA_ID=CAMNT_0050632399 /DNA_START=278 /DNA_END=3028 /DNA_ORIENTATION=-
MVRQKKRKPQGAVDFKRVKHKVGRKVAPSNNATDTSFKTRALNLREQSVVAEKDGVVVSSRNLTIVELLAKLKHHNGGVRKDAVLGLTEVLEAFGKNNGDVKSQLPTIISCVVEIVNDEDKSVRAAVRSLVELLFKLDENTESSVHWCTPFIRLFVFHVCAGLTSLQMTRRVDALDLVDLLLKYFPEMIAGDFAVEFVPRYAVLLEKALGMVGSRRGNNTSSDKTSVTTIGSSSRSGGILRNFKDTNTKKSKKRKISTSKDDTPQHQQKSVSSEVWFHVAQAFARLLLAVSRVSGRDKKGPTKQMGRFRMLRPDSGMSASFLNESEVSKTVHTPENAYGALGCIFSLWTQAQTLHRSSCDVSLGRLNHARINETWEQVKIAAELVFHLTQFLKDIGPEMQQKLQQVLTKSFPFVSTNSNEGVAVEVNGFLAGAIARVLSQNVGDDRTARQNLVKQLADWLVDVLANLSIDSNDTHRIIMISEQLLNEEEDLDTNSRARLNVALVDFFNHCFEPENIQDITAPLVSSVGRFACANFESVPEAIEKWITMLPRIVWKAGSDEDEEDVDAQTIPGVAMEALSECALVCQSLSCWDKVAKYLAVILYSQKKSTKEDLFGPFVSVFNRSTQLQLIDLISMLPVTRLPESMLRGLVHCILELALDSENNEDSELLTRMIQCVFLKFNFLLGQEEFSESELGFVLGDVVSFTVSCMWGAPRYNELSFSNSKYQHVLTCLCVELETLYCRVPISKLLSSLIQDLFNPTAYISGAQQIQDSDVQFERRVKTIGRVVAAVVGADIHNNCFPEPFLDALWVCCTYLDNPKELMVLEKMQRVRSVAARGVISTLCTFVENHSDPKVKLRMCKHWGNALTLQTSSQEVCKKALEQVQVMLEREKQSTIAFNDVLVDLKMFRASQQNSEV